MAMAVWADATDGGGPVADALAEVEARAEGLPRSLLAAKPSVVRTLAARAVDAERAAIVRRDRVGLRPDIDEDAVLRAEVAIAELRAAKQDIKTTAADTHRLLAYGNALALGAFAGVALMVGFGVAPASTPVFLGVVGAASGPLLGGGVGALRRLQATQAVQRARYLAGVAFEEAGVATPGDLHAARVRLESWQRRRTEAAAAREVAKRHREAWHRLAGPRADPNRVDDLLDRVEALRQAQLKLFAACLAEVSARRAGDILDLTVAEVVELTPPPPEGLPTRFHELLDKIRGRHLRLWRS